VNGKPKAFGILLKKQPNALIGSTAEKLRLWMTMKQHPMGKDKNNSIAAKQLSTIIFKDEGPKKHL
jgi:hypothetical protein